MSSVQTSSAFAAEAVRFASDTIGNGSYFLPDSSGPAQDLTVPGTLTVGGTTTLEGNTSVGSPATNANLLVSGTASADNYQGTNSADGFRAAFGQGLIANTVTIAGSGGSTLLLGDAATPGGNIIGYNGSAAVAKVNFGNGFSSKANADVSGTLTATLSLVTGNALICGSTASPGGQIKGYNGSDFVPPRFPLGMIGGQNAIPYLLSQPSNGTPVQGAAVTWDGSPINIQLGSSALANAQTFFNIIIPTALQSIANSGKVLYFGHVSIGGGAGAGVIVNVYNNVVGSATLLNQFGMNPTQTGGAFRGFQGIFEFGNGSLNVAGYIHPFSFAAIGPQ
jgi:hypothetical protein